MISWIEEFQTSPTEHYGRKLLANAHHEAKTPRMGTH
jgi:plasmid stabilization system protein ParE